MDDILATKLVRLIRQAEKGGHRSIPLDTLKDLLLDSLDLPVAQSEHANG